MRTAVVASLLTCLALPSPVRAASGPCAASAECAAGQACLLAGAAGTCVWEAVDAQTLIDAITAANLDEAPDVIFVGDVDLVDEAGAPLPGGPLGAEIRLDAPLAEDAGLGARALPKVQSAIEVRGLSASQSIIDIDADMRMFLLEVDPLTQRRPELLLRDVTLRDARPSEGAGFAGAVTVTGTATAPDAPGLPALPLLEAEDVVFEGGRGDAATAGAIHNDGAPLRLDGCTFVDNTGDAGAVTTSSGGVIVFGTFTGNRGAAAGAVHAPARTRVDEAGATVDVTLQINASTFEDNEGETGGAVVSRAAATTVGSTSFRDNAAFDGQGGAIQAGALAVQGGVFEDNFARAGGGAIAIVDDPLGEVRVLGPVFRRNVTQEIGGALRHVGMPLVVDEAFFEANRANGRGGAVAWLAIVNRNGADPDVRITSSVFRQNVARPTVTVASEDLTLDERGNDTGAIALRFTGEGSAIDAAAGTNVMEGNCVIGNGHEAVRADGGTLDASGNWWGDASGAGPAGLGDTASATVTSTAPLAAPPAPCAASGFSAPAQIFVPAAADGEGVAGGVATVGEDLRLVDAARGIQVLNGPTGDLVPNMRLGALDIDAVGVNDDKVEGVEALRFAVLPCNDGGCAYTTDGGALARTLTIADNGDGAAEGEGEGEGEDCVEVLSLSASSIVFTGAGTAEAPEEQTVTVTNDSACDVQLLRPFLQAGASQGFAVAPVLQTALALPPGGAVDVVVTYAQPDDADAAPFEEDAPEEGVPEEGPAGLLHVETARGAVIEVGLGLAPGCACASTHGALPWTSGALALLALLRAAARPGRAKRALPKPRQIP